MLELKFRRLQKGLTQQELAERVGIYRPELSLIENGKVSPSEDRLRRLAKALRVRVRDAHTLLNRASPNVRDN